MKHVVLTSVMMLAAMTVLTGVIYPLAATGIAQALFAPAANGSLVQRDGKTIGSALIAQTFTGAKYFHARPSAVDCNPLPSGGSNLGPTSDTLRMLIAARRSAFIAQNNLAADADVPAEMLTASASGLDPHISPDAAMAQAERVAHARGMDAAAVRAMVQAHVEGPQFGLLGEPRVNVLLLNAALDGVR